MYMPKFKVESFNLRDFDEKVKRLNTCESVLVRRLALSNTLNMSSWNRSNRR